MHRPLTTRGARFVLLLLLAAPLGCNGGQLLPSGLPTPPDLTQPTPGATNQRTTEPPASLPPAGPVPAELFAEIAAEAAALAGVPAGDLAVGRAEAVVWSDGSLGCPERDQQYTQALVDGYWVVLVAGGQEYDFRASERGEFKLCPPGQGRPPVGE
jgi:hypothetical protein